jgi:hypothetical protein
MVEDDDEDDDDDDDACMWVAWHRTPTQRTDGRQTLPQHATPPHSDDGPCLFSAAGPTANLACRVRACPMLVVVVSRLACFARVRPGLARRGAFVRA